MLFTVYPCVISEENRQQYTGVSARLPWYPTCLVPIRQCQIHLVFECGIITHFLLYLNCNRFTLKNRWMTYLLVLMNSYGYYQISEKSPTGGTV